MTSAQPIAARHPEWAPWLGIVDVALADVQDSAWEDAVAAAGMPVTGDPPPALRAHAALRRAAYPIARLYARLRRAACSSGLPKLSSWSEGVPDEAALMAYFHAALHADDGALAPCAQRAGVDADAFAAVMALLPMPYLHACRRRFEGTVALEWAAGHCPCCGAWPALLEVCGIERRRYLRCGRCAAAWPTECLRCPYCAASEHAQLATLRVEGEAREAAIEVCNRCRGYVKVLHALQPAPAHEVMLLDLATVDLDVAALGRDYRRPRGLGCAPQKAIA